MQIQIETRKLSFAKGAFSVEVPFADMSESVLSQIFYEGARRVLGDGIGKAELSKEEKIALVNKRVDSWKRGDFASRERESGPETVESRARKLAIKMLQQEPRFKAAQLKIEGRMDELKAEADQLAATAEYKQAAEQQLALEASLASLKVKVPA